MYAADDRRAAMQTGAPRRVGQATVACKAGDEDTWDYIDLKVMKP